MNKNFVSAEVLADILSVSKKVLSKWEASGKITISKNKKYFLPKLKQFPEVSAMLESTWEKDKKTKPLRNYRSIELFAGAGGLALGLEQAGFCAVALNEVDKDACDTLTKNRKWNVIADDIKNVDFCEYKGIDLLTGGFPCQSFSYAGKQLGFKDIRGNLFFEFARAIKETRPKVFMGENVKGLLTHDGGRTLATIKNVIAELGYTLVEPRLLKAIFFEVPQKRERLILVGIRNDLVRYAKFNWPKPAPRVMVLKDALKSGDLYKKDVPVSAGQSYPKRKCEILKTVPQGGYWKDLTEDLKIEYMQKSYFLGGGKTGMARRLSWEEPSLTLTCSPAQKQTERCHPEETRPLTFREYARIQTFPDDWEFSGSLTKKYKQIGNAVPVNLSYALGRSLIRLLNAIIIRKKLKKLHKRSRNLIISKNT